MGEITADKIIVALDFATADEALRFVDKMKGEVKSVKVGMELYYSAGPSIITELKDRGFKIFLDLKLHDIPNTVKSAMAVLCKHGVDMINVHALGGLAMMKEAKEVRDKISPKTKLIAVTQLTSTTKEQMQCEQRISGELVDSVFALASLAKEAGLDGVVCSAQESKMLREKLGADFLLVTPGIRSQGVSADDQKRVTTPREAFINGSSHIVMGREITKSEKPKETMKAILKGIQ